MSTPSQGSIIVEVIIMKKLLHVSLLVLLTSALSSCCSSNDSFRLDKMTKSGLSLDDLCSEIRIVPLEFPETIECSKLQYAAGKYFLLEKTRERVLVFSSSGAYLHSIDGMGKILNISTFGDNLLDILVEKAVLEYDIQKNVLSARYPIPSSGTDAGLSRKEGGRVVVVSGESSNGDYYCEYYLDDDKFFEIGNPIPVPSGVIQTSDYFRSADGTFFFYSHTGDIWRDGIFFSRAYEWNFSGISEEFFVPAVQMTEEMIYMNFSDSGALGTFLYDRIKRKQYVFHETTEGKTFPVGLIDGRLNHFFCPSDDRTLYVPEDVKCDSTTANLVLVYTLNDL